jgi:hypothetical protein
MPRADWLSHYCTTVFVFPTATAGHGNTGSSVQSRASGPRSVEPGKTAVFFCYCTPIKYLLGVTGIGLGTTAKYLRRTTSAAAGNALPCGVEAFVVNSEPHTWARRSVRGCVGPELNHCVHKQLCLILSSEKEC